MFYTGASLAITNSKEGFVKPSQPLLTLFLGGIADGLEVMALESFLGPLWTMIILKFKLSLMDIISLKERQDC